MDVKRIRSKVGISQEEFATSLGTTQPTVAKWESGSKKPRPHFIATIRELFADAIAEAEYERLFQNAFDAFALKSDQTLMMQNFKLRQTIKVLRSELLESRKEGLSTKLSSVERELIEDDLRNLISYLPYTDIIKRLENSDLKTLNQVRKLVGLSSLSDKVSPSKLTKNDRKIGKKVKSGLANSS